MTGLGGKIVWTMTYSCRTHSNTLWQRTFLISREMQGIVGQASDFKLGGQLSVFFERLSQRSTELPCTRFDEERSRKSKAIDEQRCGTVFFGWTHQPTHEFDCRTSSGCRCLWGTHVCGHARTCYRVGHGLRLPMRKKMNVEEKT